MSFVSGLFGGGAQSAQIDKGATTEQATNVYNQQQGAINQQQNFANAVAAQNGLGNQNTVYQQLAGIANGTGPSVAQAQLAQATQANVANQAALMAGSRGSSQNAGLIARQAAMQGANTQQQAAGQAATLRAQETQNSLGQMGSLATNQVNQQQSALSNLSGATNTAQSNILGAINGQNNAAVQMQSNVNNNNTAMAQAAMQMGGKIAGGVLSGGATAMMAHGGMVPEHGRFVEAHNRLHGIKSDPKMMADGGAVPGHASVRGDSLSNDTQPTMLSPGEVVIPRSIMQSEDPVKAAADFVKKVIAGKGPAPAIKDGQKKMADGGLTTENPDLKQPQDEVPDYTKIPEMTAADFAKFGVPQGKIDDLSPMATTGSTGSWDDNGKSGGDLPPSVGDQPGTMSRAPQDPYGYGAMADNTMGGYGKAVAGLNMQADAEGRKAQAESAAADEQVKNAQSMQQSYQQEFSKLDQDRKGFQQALMNGKIDPDHYLNNRTGGQKVSQAIGLILGGLGGALAGTGNPALEFLHKQIDRDIDAQKADMGKSENLLHMNMQQFGNLHDATMATKAMMADVYAAKLVKAGADSGSEAAKARAMQAAGDLQMKVAPMMQQMAMRKAMMSGGGSPEMKIRMMVPEGQQQAMFKQLGDAQNMIKTRDNLVSAFDKVNKLSTIGGTITSPLQTGRQRDAIVKPLLAQLSKDSAGRFTEADAEYIENLFPARGDSEKTVNLKRQQLNSFVSSKMHFPELNAYGIDPTSSGRFDAAGKDKIQQRKLGGQ